MKLTKVILSISWACLYIKGGYFINWCYDVFHRTFCLPLFRLVSTLLRGAIASCGAPTGTRTSRTRHTVSSACWVR